jgi:hypothetical protein
MTPIESATGEPFLRVLRGNPTPEEVAAVVVALIDQDRQAGDHTARPARRGRRRRVWADPARTLRLHPYHQPQ